MVCIEHLTLENLKLIQDFNCRRTMKLLGYLIIVLVEFKDQKEQHLADHSFLHGGNGNELKIPNYVL